MKLSFIVPVYNVAPYLRKCVESLLAQDYDNYEIILVDDGSTDESSRICDEYVSSNELVNDSVRELERPLIRVIHQKNGGLSAARNTGIKAAKGEYVCFVDSDDYWEPKVLGGLMAQVEREKLDVLRFDYRNVRVVDAEHIDVTRLEPKAIDAVHLDYEVFEPNKTPRYIDKCNEIVDGGTYLNTRMGYACYAVMFVIKRSLIYKSRTTLDAAHLEPMVLDTATLDNSCLFTEGIYFEDTEWIPRMMVRAQRVNATPKVVYNYLTRIGSITKRYDKEHTQKKIESLMKVNISLQKLLRIVQDRRWFKGCIADNVLNILNNTATYDYESVSSVIDTIRKNNMLPLQGYKVRKIIMLRYGIINLSPRLYCWLRHIRMQYFS